MPMGTFSLVAPIRNHPSGIARRIIKTFPIATPTTTILAMKNWEAAYSVARVANSRQTESDSEQETRAGRTGQYMPQGNEGH
jgi:hypothetical protein